MHQGPQTLESIAHDEGRFLAVQGASGTEFIDTWQVTEITAYLQVLRRISAQGTVRPVGISVVGGISGEGCIKGLPDRHLIYPAEV